MIGETAVDAVAQLLPRGRGFRGRPAVAVPGIGGEPWAEVDRGGGPRRVAHQLEEHLVVVEAFPGNRESDKVAPPGILHGGGGLGRIVIHLAGVGRLAAHVGDIAHDPALALIRVVALPGVFAESVQIRIVLGIVEDQQAVVVGHRVHQGRDGRGGPDAGLVGEHPTLQDPDGIGIRGDQGVVGIPAIPGQERRGIARGQVHFVEAVHEIVTGLPKFVAPCGDVAVHELREERFVGQDRTGVVVAGKSAPVRRRVQVQARVDAGDARGHESGKALHHRLDPQFARPVQDPMLERDLVRVPGIGQGSAHLAYVAHPVPGQMRRAGEIFGDLRRRQSDVLPHPGQDGLGGDGGHHHGVPMHGEPIELLLPPFPRPEGEGVARGDHVVGVANLERGSARGGGRIRPCGRKVEARPGPADGAEIVGAQIVIHAPAHRHGATAAHREHAVRGRIFIHIPAVDLRNGFQHDPGGHVRADHPLQHSPRRGNAVGTGNGSRLQANDGGQNRPSNQSAPCSSNFHNIPPWSIHGPATLRLRRHGFRPVSAAI